MEQLDTKKLVRSLGGRREVWSMLKAEGLSISQKAVDKWTERGSIPSYALIKIILAAQKFRGITINLKDFITTNHNENNK
jgi:hypothetical protein